MTYAPIVRRDPFRSSTRWTNAPDVQFVREPALDEVNECRVRRPQRKATVEPGGRGEDGPIPHVHTAVRHEERVTGAGCVVCESGGVVRPVELGHAFKVWPRLAT